MDLETVEDLLLYLPRSYEDLTQMSNLATAELDKKHTFQGVIDNLKRIRTRHGKTLVTAKFRDEAGELAEVIWFNQPHIMRMLQDGDDVVLTGKLIQNGSKIQIQSPTFEAQKQQSLVHAGRLVPIYPQHDVINTKWLREKIVTIKDAIDLLPETLPEEVLKEEDLPMRADAIRALHFPEDGEEVELSKKRMAFEEMYNVQCDALTRKQEWQGEKQDRLSIQMDTELIKTFFASLNFTPTDSQKIAIYEILQDMEKPYSM